MLSTTVLHHASQLTDWLWQAFGDGTSCEFYASIVRSSLHGCRLPGDLCRALDEYATPLGTVGFWRCGLISPVRTLSVDCRSVCRRGRARTGHE